MSLRAHGKKYSLVYLNGKRYTKAYYKGRLVMLTPDRNTYLMAGPDTYLKAGKKIFLSFKNRPQFVSYTADYALGADKDFCLSFRFFYQALSGSKRLVELPGALLLETASLSGYALRVRMLCANKIYAVNTAGFTDGWCRVELARKNGTLCLFAAGRRFVLDNADLPDSPGGWAVATKDRTIIDDAAFWPEAKTAAGSVFPALP